MSHTPARGWARRITARVLALALTLAGLAVLAHHDPSAPLSAEPAAVSTTQAAVTPPSMGWASWNSFASSIDSTVIKQQTDALVSSGMATAGYQYVNLDDGWWQGARNADGSIAVDANLWPSGMQAVADYIHSKGLKAGIYTDAGKQGCGYYYPTTRPAAPNTGMEGHYQQDLETFQRWGFDYVKIDWCGGRVEGLDPETTYKAIAAANEAATAVTGHRLVLSFCEWGSGLPWNWATGYGDLWRTSTDVILWGQTPTTSLMLTNFDRGLHPAAQHTGYYNDPDMLMVGMNGLTAAQNRLHMGLWAISGAPLLAGNNLATMSTATRDILTNPEVIAVDQDPRGLQGVKVAEDSRNLQVYGKVLAGTGKCAVLLLNRTSASASMTVRWADLGLTNASASVRNAWTGTNAGSYGTSYSATVPAGDAVLLTVTGTEASGSTYEDTSTATTPTFSAVTTGAAGTELVDITYANSGSTARKATIQVNGQYTSVVSFPPTGSASTYRTVSVLAHLAKGTNTVRFAAVSGATAPDIDAIRVQDIPGTNGVALVGAASNRCAGLEKNTITDGSQALLWDCFGGRNETFTQTSRGELVVYGNKCLDANAAGTTNGTKVIIWNCNGGTNQKWTVHSDGTITNNLSGLCLDAEAAATANGTKLVLWTCNGQTNQQWTLN
ncbi:ricin-type beta-trefoil lectin domain protein [Streptomyces sp. WI04-05B]|uniref:ricin-type beta-trefoil lectin domain protein n=1 Tax=Streptomyces TaxID=1883 RepID=UPI0029A30DEC|nr:MULTISPECIES: RICIN domain-containing protein [unclassified Streptomyces]MDX2543553.1 ricin-type beta-trefoil lectin domain protein [Streptomyces sp. WI04-05B]MDX2582959.1 ricin-type beta-trefoil lectin domain protein [Streptomyces sp. WI04-05A]